MDTIREEAREIPVVATCDVCVVGGSCTGVFAAVRAAQLGAKACLVENNGFFGGVATAGLVNLWHSLYDTTGKRQIIAGLTAEMLDRLRRRGAAVQRGTVPEHYELNPAELVLELDALVTEAGVQPFLHTRFVQPVAEGGRMTAAIVEDKSGRRAIRARLFVDATGDGDVIARMGLPFRKLDDLQPPTTCMILHGLDAVRRQNPGFSLSQAAHDPKYPEALKPGFLWHAAVPGLPDAHMVAGTRASGSDCSDADALTRASLETRRQVRAICDILRRHIPGGDKIALAALSSYIGIRETRHATCLHTLTDEELLHGQRFDDAIANGTYPVDVHHSNRPG
ncbi:MAG: FAD-dependent oxidoreductase, partial [Planctomycetes bacterium]|nr:FAD-dependent oxidoreductase [Planctomycetota bacterium]